MKTFRHFLSALLFLTCWAPTYAQIHIDADEDIGIGQNTTDDSKMRLYNNDNAHGFYLTANGTTSSGATGIYNEVIGDGTGVKLAVHNSVTQGASSTKNALGIFNWTVNYGTGIAYGISNWMPSSGPSLKYGIYGDYTQVATSTNNIFGNYTRVRNNGSGLTYGNYLLINDEGGAADKYGSLMIVRQPTSSTRQAYGNVTTITHYGTGTSAAYDALVTADGTGTKYGLRSKVYENAAAQNSTYGIHNSAYLYGPRVGYGFYNYVYDNAGSSNTKYGIYNYVQDKTSGDTKYGLFNYLEKSGTGTSIALWSGVSDSGDYAGYFAGNVGVTGTVMDGLSDGRLKEDAQALVGALGLIAQLQPKSYRFKSDLGIPLPEGRQYGLIAQELEPVMPDLVMDFKVPGQPIYAKTLSSTAVMPEPNEGQVADQAPMGKDQLASDALVAPTQRIQRNPTVEENQIVGYEPEQNFKAINYRALIPVLVGAVQEQQAQIESLRAEVQSLRAELKRVAKQK
ncbi:MAG: tail fiber domain-containing protein [Bacteroidota bacterium]